MPRADVVFISQAINQTARNENENVESLIRFNARVHLTTNCLV
jgi:hypothetical protein